MLLACGSGLPARPTDGWVVCGCTYSLAGIIFLRSLADDLMATVMAGYVVCPVCGESVREPNWDVMPAHCDGVGNSCPFSGREFGGVAK